MKDKRGKRTREGLGKSRRRRIKGRKRKSR
jgi:hypothetical protein